jgi:glycerophosphoryl diester phosphodiesterase
VCVTSFSDARIARVRAAAGPALCTSTGPGAIAALRLASVVPFAPRRGPWRGAGATQVPTAWGRLPILEERYIRFCHRAGLAVHAWTIDDEPTMARLLDAGVDGIMTDQPTRLRQLLVRRGQWAGAD